VKSSTSPSKKGAGRSGRKKQLPALEYITNEGERGTVKTGQGQRGGKKSRIIEIGECVARR